MELERNTMIAAEAHAAESYPRESCGLVIVKTGRQRYFPCENIAAGAEHFVIAPQDYARAEDDGEIVAVVHSHPDGVAIPSEHDRVVCEETGLPWFIAAARKLEGAEQIVVISEWGSLVPCGYRAPLVGRSFSHGKLDCYSIIRDWYARERGITLPDFVRKDEWWHAGQNLYVENFAAAGFRPLTESEQPEVGDVFLAAIRSPVPNHGGVYIGDGLVLHHLHGRLSSRDVYGGYLAENTTRWLRFKESYEE